MITSPLDRKMKGPYYKGKTVREAVTLAAETRDVWLDITYELDPASTSLLTPELIKCCFMYSSDSRAKSPMPLEAFTLYMDLKAARKSEQCAHRITTNGRCDSCGLARGMEDTIKKLFGIA